MTTRKTTAKTSTRRTPAKRKAPAKRTPADRVLLPVSHEERWRMIAEAAYYIAQRRGFVGGDALADWIAAEAQVDARLKAEGPAPGHPATRQTRGAE
jgi:hypothetical protein